MKNSLKLGKRVKILLTIIAVVLIVIVCVIIGIATNKKDIPAGNLDKNQIDTENKQEEIAEEKVDIIDVNSNTRPYAVVVNNTAVAVKVQEGLNKAYLVYEIPTEGNTSRLMALYKDVEESLVIGTIRSASSIELYLIPIIHIIRLKNKICLLFIIFFIKSLLVIIYPTK